MLRADGVRFAQQRIVHASQTLRPGEIPRALRAARDAVVRPAGPIATGAVTDLSWSRNMNYHVAPLFCRPWTLNGISARLIESHYEHNYGGAVARLNAISRELQALDPKTASGEAIGRLKRDEMAALNST